jgi:(1->4)-alpha-D-glucan 1-alpha-D-glucosylmutase
MSMADKKLSLTATYRQQFRKEYSFQEATDNVDYLHALGISTIYSSPILEATPGSNHGYDAIDLKISEERGGEAAFKQLADKAATMDMNVVIDIVPNHMASSTLNPYFADVLAEGRQSDYWSEKPNQRHVFDMRVPEDCKIQVPVLGGTADEAWQKGELKFDMKGQDPCLCYYDKCFRLKKETIAGLRRECGSGDLKSYLASVPKDEIRTIADDQNFELVNWATTQDHVSWRRFFDVTDLIGVRVEDPGVYELTHALYKKLAQDMPNLLGIRVDHVDGLVDPAGYLKRLGGDFKKIWIEKILGPGEALPEEWPVAGTTGYEFIADVNGLMADKAGSDKIEEFFRTLQPKWENFEDCVAEGKELVLEMLFHSELKRLVELSAIDAEGRKQAAVFWRGVTVGMEVYRPYYTDGAMGGEDRKAIDRALAFARARYGVDFIAAEKRFGQALLNPSTEREKQAVREWQQLSGPTMAKGLEDTAHYRYFPNSALNEVGCTPDLPPHGQTAFFANVNRRGATHPETLKASTTHDTKRSEDVRARLYGLSAMPEQWISFFKKSADLNKDCRDVSGAPERQTEYLLYQTLLGTWPLDHKIDDIYKERIQAYMLKAIKEAKLETSWLKPDERYENGVRHFIDAIFLNRSFVKEVNTFAGRLSRMGAFNSLTMQTLKILSPGVPDIYQGTEIWDYSMVDPDNRRPVDYRGNAGLLAATHALDQEKGRPLAMKKLTDEWHSGAVKQWLTKSLLQIRKDFILPMGKLEMEQISVTGPHADRLIAYRLQSAGGGQGGGITVIVPRNIDDISADALRIDEKALEGTRLELDAPMRAASYIDLLSGERRLAEEVANLAKTLSVFPVAVLSYRF